MDSDIGHTPDSNRPVMLKRSPQPMCYRLHTLLIVLAVGPAALTVGCLGPMEPNVIPEAGKLALERADQFELLSLEPTVEQHDGENDSFHRWHVLGKVTIEQKKSRERILAALSAGVPEHQGPVASCFIPRHGIRVVHAGKTYDFVICFECHAVAVYTDPSGADESGGFQIDSSPQPVFDEELVKAGIALAKKAGSE
jgi:hypothetical protein